MATENANWRQSTRKCLINAIIVQVKSAQIPLSGKATNQELTHLG
jgi:hypothetical protein